MLFKKIPRNVRNSTIKMRGVSFHSLQRYDELEVGIRLGGIFSRPIEDIEDDAVW